jgi:transcription elongation GreA/GreB family factor
MPSQQSAGDIVSRAFVKEPEGDEARPERPRRRHSDLPNYITPAGAIALHHRVAALNTERQSLAENQERLGGKADLQRIEEDLEYFQERLRRAIVVQPPRPPWQAVEVGAEVELIDQVGRTHHFRIVGEDEIDVPGGCISWSSPLGRAVLQRQVGDVVNWRRPAGDLEVEIVAIAYPES